VQGSGFRVQGARCRVQGSAEAHADLAAETRLLGEAEGQVQHVVLLICRQALRIRQPPHPGVELRANLKSISHRCYLFEVAFAWELTK